MSEGQPFLKLKSERPDGCGQIIQGCTLFECEVSMKNRTLVLVTLLLLTFLFGLSASARSLEGKAKHDAQKADRCITKARKKVPDCEIRPTFQTCIELHNSELQLQDVLTALDAYCGGSDFSSNKGNCTPPTDKASKTKLAGKLRQTLDNLNHNIGTARAFCDWQLPLLL
jgi:hypothetical protein